MAHIEAAKNRQHPHRLTAHPRLMVVWIRRWAQRVNSWIHSRILARPGFEPRHFTTLRVIWCPGSGLKRNGALPTPSLRHCAVAPAFPPGQAEFNAEAGRHPGPASNPS